jgi:hypothetical protein
VDVEFKRVQSSREKIGGCDPNKVNLVGERRQLGSVHVLIDAKKESNAVRLKEVTPLS